MNNIHTLKIIKHSEIKDILILAIINAILEIANEEITYEGNETYLLYFDRELESLKTHAKLHPSPFAFTTVRRGIRYANLYETIDAILI